MERMICLSIFFQVSPSRRNAALFFARAQPSIGNFADLPRMPGFGAVFERAQGRPPLAGYECETRGGRCPRRPSIHVRDEHDMRPNLAACYGQEHLPRYTSYPTAPHFSAAVGPDTYAEWLKAIPRNACVSLYLHVP